MSDLGKPGFQQGEPSVGLKKPSKRKHYIIIAILLALLWAEENLKLPVFLEPQTISPERTQFAEYQYQTARQYFNNKEYEKALVRLRLIFPIMNDYKDSREMERQALKELSLHPEPEPKK